MLQHFGGGVGFRREGRAVGLDDLGLLPQSQRQPPQRARPRGAEPVCLVTEVAPELLAGFPLPRPAIDAGGRDGDVTRHVTLPRSSPEGAVTRHAPFT